MVYAGGKIWFFGSLERRKMPSCTRLKDLLWCSLRELIISVTKHATEKVVALSQKQKSLFSQQIFFVQQKCGVAMAPLSRLPQLHRPCSSFFTSRKVASVNSQLQSFLRFEICIYVNKHIFQLIDDLKEYSGLIRYLQWEKVIYQRLGPDFHIFYQSSLLSLSQPEVAALYPSIPHDVKNVKRLQKTMDFLNGETKIN